MSDHSFEHDVHCRRLWNGLRQHLLCGGSHTCHELAVLPRSDVAWLCAAAPLHIMTQGVWGVLRRRPLSCSESRRQPQRFRIHNHKRWYAFALLALRASRHVSCFFFVTPMIASQPSQITGQVSGSGTYTLMSFTCCHELTGEKPNINTGSTVIQGQVRMSKPPGVNAINTDFSLITYSTSGGGCALLFAVSSCITQLKRVLVFCCVCRRVNVARCTYRYAARSSHHCP